uniref:NADH-ubiquinone oxidoreductase chain 4 n=1 Tax=Proteus anguinus TaxID=221568 RepID=C9DHG9_PROAG|nr:NADH dehydrogenase subunit 4 [Proteus anguinus]ACU00374.1 NADH dehydrogenase subunit 4 [Proteus anguinus]
MLKIFVSTTMMIPLIMISPMKWLWSNTVVAGFSIAIVSLALLNHPTETPMKVNQWMIVDQISSPLLVLTCWLLPLMILASQKHIKTNPATRQRTYILMLVFLQMALIIAFSASELMLFYIAFETTLIPTLVIITRWGNQMERLNAGHYFLFYTLAGSFPLLAALLLMNASTGSLSILLMEMGATTLSPIDELLWLACLVAFLVKMPLYGVHLWLPKAHVEAPIAGSMVLAAILLKLGGYGIIRVSFLLISSMKEMSYPFIILALWGAVMTGLICMRQTDLKALIAYSSVSHMGLVVAATLIQTPWGLMGATLLMISHGLTSSALFCLANLNYERTHSRTLIMMRGAQAVLPILAVWWLLANLSNMALPPTTNLWGELTIMVSLFNWSKWTIMMTGAIMLITAMYTLHMLQTTQRGPTPLHLKQALPPHTREHYLMLVHILPIILLMLKPELISGGT